MAMGYWPRGARDFWLTRLAWVEVFTIPGFLGRSVGLGGALELDVTAKQNPG